MLDNLFQCFTFPLTQHRDSSQINPLLTRGSHREVSAAVSSVFVCQYDNGNFNGDITNLFLSPRIDRIRSTEKQS